MNRKARILVIEDDKGDADLMSMAIEKTSIALPLKLVASYEDALHEIQSEYYHLLLVDLNLHGGEPYDIESFEGLWLLQDIQEMGFGYYLPVIILTSYGTEKVARDAFKEYNAVDFIDKKESAQFNEANLSKRLKEIFKDELEINLELDIKFKGDLDWTSLIETLLHRSDRTIPTLTKVKTENELEDLFCKLFHSAKTIEIAPLQPGHSGAGVVKVTPYYNEGKGGDRIVKYGDWQQIQKESDNFDNYVQTFMQGDYRTQKEDFKRTLSFGGIVYTLIGSGDKEICNFSHYYSDKNSFENITGVLNNLFNQTCALWYENRKEEREHDLMELYTKHLELTPKKLEQAFRFKFSSEYVEESKFSFKGIGGEFSNPVIAFCEGKAMFKVPTHLCITHGDLNGSNILIDSFANTWLIDFYFTGWKHCLADFIKLETVIKFQLTSGKSLKELQLFEQALLQPEEFGEEIVSAGGMSEELLKSLEIIKYLRIVAGEKVKPRKNIKEYYVGLLYRTLNLLRFHRLIKRRLKKYHILLSASMIYEKLQSMT